jgi:hypothetical protein
MLIGTPDQSGSHYELIVYCLPILILLALAVAMAIILIAMFNKEMNLWCCKKEEIDTQDFQDADFSRMKSIITKDKNTFQK